MIIRCEECATRFRLDEERIPERGARVRCSRCDHSFVVRRPASEEADREAAVSLAKEAVTTAVPRTNPPEADQSNENQSTTAIDATARANGSESQTAQAESSPRADDDEDWEFGPSEADVPGASEANPSSETPEGPSPAEASHQESAPPEPAAPPPPAVKAAPPAPEPEAEPAPEPAQPPARAEQASAETREAPAQTSGASIDDLLTHEDGVERAVAASQPTPPLEADEPDAGTSPFDIDDPFGSSGMDLSGTGTLESDDRDFEAAAADVEAQAAVDAAGDANGDSLAAVGDPSSWNLLSEEEATPDPAEMPDAVAPAAREDPLFPPTDLFAEGDSSQAGLGSGESSPPAASRDGDFLPGVGGTPEDVEEEEASSSLFQRVAQGASWVAWPLTVLLALVASWNLLSPQEPPPSSRFLTLEKGFELRGLESRVIENTLGGPLLVVSGVLRNSGVEPRALESAVAVTLLDVEGNRFDEAQALMAPTPDALALREKDPTFLRGHGDHAARRFAFRPLSPGEERSFSAVFDGIPGGATRFSIDLHRLPGPPSAPPLVAPLREAGTEDGSAAGDSGQTGTPARPIETATALPSGAPLSPE